MRSVKRTERSCHSMSALVCGLDVHKDSTYATILSPEGKVVNQTRMTNERVLPYLKQFSISKVGMESSNQIAPLFRLLTAKVAHVVGVQKLKQQVKNGLILIVLFLYM